MSAENYQTAWIIPNRVLYVAWGDVVTLDTHANLNAAILEHFAQTDNFVSIIADTSAVKEYPVNAYEVTKRLDFPHNPKLAWMISIIENPTIRFIAMLVANATGGGRYRTRKTLFEAYELLNEIDPQFNLEELRAFQVPR